MLQYTHLMYQSSKYQPVVSIIDVSELQFKRIEGGNVYRQQTDEAEKRPNS